MIISTPRYHALINFPRSGFRNAFLRDLATLGIYFVQLIEAPFTMDADSVELYGKFVFVGFIK